MNSVATGMFPLFAASFFDRDEDVPISEPPSTSRAFQQPLPTLKSGIGGPRGSSLRALDLQTLPRDDGPPTELRTRKEKLAHYEQQCSHVGDCLYVGGEVVAKNREILHQNHITHVVNCVGFLYPPYFEDDFDYQTLYLQDTPAEDILAVLYDVFDFIEGARDGRVLIHCSQGVSRSTTLAIAYRMWREGRTYEDIFAEVKQMRGVANPNIGFICQLLQWHKRRTDDAGSARLYRIAPQSQSAPQYLVPKLAATRPAALDPRGAFVLHYNKHVFVWNGSQCPEAFAVAAQRVAAQLHKYEGAESPPIVIKQGEESDEFWIALTHPGHQGSNGCGTPPPLSPDTEAIGAPSHVRAYDRDYELYNRSLLPSVESAGSLDPLDSARSGRKTPRDPMPEHAASPNDRLRKQARSEALERELRSARSSGSSGYTSGLGTESARNRALDFQELAVRRRAPSPSALPSPSQQQQQVVPSLPLPGAATAATGAAAAGTALPIGTATTRTKDSDLSVSDDSEDDDDVETTISDDSDEDGSMPPSDDDDDLDDGDGKGGEPSGGGGAAAPRPAGVPRLNLGR